MEVQLGISLTVPIGPRWSLELTGARSGPDPLLGSPAGLDGSVLVSWNAAASAVGGSPLVTLIADGSTVAVFRLPLKDARSVSVLGDFSDWQPIPMAKQGKTWVARVPVQPGLYHFGFLVDGDWHVPEGAPGKITDEFGRWNATLVVPGE